MKSDYEKGINLVPFILYTMHNKYYCITLFLQSYKSTVRCVNVSGLPVLGSGGSASGSGDTALGPLSQTF